MVLTSYKPKTVIVYTSLTGNTEQLAEMLQAAILNKELPVELYRIEDFSLNELSTYDYLLIGTYTWGSGEIPNELHNLYDAIEQLKRHQLRTAVFGTGDSFFAEFCGAVDRFRDMLYVKTQLVATLKVEQMPQHSDMARCEKLAELIN
ncbi:flavodoxin domain-containing protein [Planococcus versutus]|uniref:Flavodoxin n=1 Tax=Planococcus versutus TaxID=1302659 RepID=A0A1B1S1F9_9BACL|nr:flavodoxin domain-containing protein [Planococcus versutus]ANU27016.1 flavodoxin [Planococcus versutus]